MEGMDKEILVHWVSKAIGNTKKIDRGRGIDTCCEECNMKVVACSMEETRKRAIESSDGGTITIE